jgi:hypothetical protein
MGSSVVASVAVVVVASGRSARLRSGSWSRSRSRSMDSEGGRGSAKQRAELTQSAPRSNSGLSWGNAAALGRRSAPDCIPAMLSTGGGKDQKTACFQPKMGGSPAIWPRRRRSSAGKLVVPVGDFQGVIRQRRWSWGPPPVCLPASAERGRPRSPRRSAQSPPQFRFGGRRLGARRAVGRSLRGVQERMGRVLLHALELPGFARRRMRLRRRRAPPVGREERRGDGWMYMMSASPSATIPAKGVPPGRARRPGG